MRNVVYTEHRELVVKTPAGCDRRLKPFATVSRASNRSPSPQPRRTTPMPVGVEERLSGSSHVHTHGGSVKLAVRPAQASVVSRATVPASVASWPSDLDPQVAHVRPMTAFGAHELELQDASTCPIGAPASSALVQPHAALWSGSSASLLQSWMQNPSRSPVGAAATVFSTCRPTVASVATTSGVPSALIFSSAADVCVGSTVQPCVLRSQ